MICFENLDALTCPAAEQSSSAGVLLSDVIHLQDGAPPVAVMFGCETRETGEIYNQAADGILGLGDSPVSLINQVHGLLLEATPGGALTPE